MTDSLAINLDAGCWLTTGTLTRLGYARRRVHGEMTDLHRYMWIVMRGPIPNGLEIDHLCEVRHCLNPQHMTLTTHRANTLRSRTNPTAINSRKTQCPQGHPYDATNTRRDRNAGRYCRKCHAERSRRTRARKQEDQRP